MRATAPRRRASLTRGEEKPPVPVVALAVLAVSMFALPLAGLLWRAPWSDAWSELTAPGILTTLRLSLVSTLAATALSCVLGVPLAWVQARVSYPGRTFVRALTTLPMVIPPVVGGVALLLAFGRRGLIGQWLDGFFGIRLPFTLSGAVLAEAFVAMPFFVVTVEAGLRSIDLRLEEAARTLGAGRWIVFRRVTVPLLRPSLVAGAVLCWARALGEFGATITFAGNVPGKTQTVPLAVFEALQTRPEAAIVLSLVLLAVSLAVLVALRDRWLGVQ